MKLCLNNLSKKQLNLYHCVLEQDFKTILHTLSFDDIIVLNNFLKCHLEIDMHKIRKMTNKEILNLKSSLLLKIRKKI